MAATVQQLDQAIGNGQITMAVQLGESLYRSSPQSQHIALSLSEAYRLSGATAKARLTAEKAFALAPEFPFARAQLLRCLIPYADHAAMRGLLDQVRHDNNKDLWCLQAFADAAVAIDEWELARHFFAKLEGSSSSDGQKALAQYMRAVSYQISGENDVAVELLRLASQTPAVTPRAYSSLVSVEPSAVTISRLKSLLADETIPAKEKRYLWQALGQKQHDESHYQEAFKCWQQANQLSQPFNKYSPQQWEAFFYQLREGVAAAETFNSEEVSASEDSPVFIIGLPRSGSTLIEQLLVASGQVQALGELRDLEVSVQQMLERNIRPLPLDMKFDDWRRVEHKSLARLYQKKIASRLHPGMIPCDKNPANVLWLGVILKTWPNARIIHVHKTPEAACLGLYRQLFAAAAPWSYHLEDIAHYYQHYRSLVVFWQQQFPGRVLDVSYEGFVLEPQGQGRQIFHYLGLDWNDSIIAGIGQQKGMIPTASSSQIRGGLHQQYLHTWESYKTQLEPFTKAIA